MFFQVENIETDRIDALVKVYATKIATDIRASVTVEEDEESSVFSQEAEDLMADLFLFAKQGKFRSFMAESKSKSQYAYAPQTAELSVIQSSIHKSMVEMLKVTDAFREV